MGRADTSGVKCRQPSEMENLPGRLALATAQHAVHPAAEFPARAAELQAGWKTSSRWIWPSWISSESSMASLRALRSPGRSESHALSRRPDTGATGYLSTTTCEAWRARRLSCSPRTSGIRVGAAGIMLPNHAPLKVAETFRTLLAMYPGRIDLALGRAPGTDPLTAHVLRRGMVTDPAAEFPGQVAELLAWLADDFPAGHPYEQLVAAPVVAEQPQLFVLGSSGYGPRFAAVNGMSAAFAHHMSPDIAFESLRGYRREFQARTPGATP